MAPAQGQGRLADAAGAADRRDYHRAARHILAEQRIELLQLGLAADEMPHAGGQLPRDDRSLPGPQRGRRRSEGRIGVQDLVLQVPELGSWLDAQLGRKYLPAFLVASKCRCLPARAVERQHELATEPFAERVLRNEGGQLDGQLRMPAGRQRGISVVRLYRESLLVERGGLGSKAVGDVGDVG